MANLADDILPDPEKNSRLLRDHQYKRLGIRTTLRIHLYAIAGFLWELLKADLHSGFLRTVKAYLRTGL